MNEQADLPDMAFVENVDAEQISKIYITSSNRESGVTLR